jgi:hypothetical protein
VSRSGLRHAWLGLFGFLGLFAGVAARPSDEGLTVILTGDADGNLSPCGCTSPMMGGLRRLVTALRQETSPIVLDNGGLSDGTSRQDTIKAETAAQALDLTKVGASNFAGRDARLGRGEALSLIRLSGGRMVSTSLRPGSSLPIAPWRVAGPFLVGGTTSRPDLLAQGLQEETSPPEEAAHRLVEEASDRRLVPILLFDGTREAAIRISKAEPALRLVTYRATGSPPDRLERIGECAVATPGENGKDIVRLVWRDGRFVASSTRSLGPELKNDPGAAQLYRSYLRRVEFEHLLERVDRTPGKPFAGSEKCGSCHRSAEKVWRASGHAHALLTLERDGHGRDPECVVCHVVGLTKTTGFQSRSSTPRLANVGCESCHGAGAAHAASPWKVRLPKVGRPACLPCHTLGNSPNFDFSRYWAKIRH